MTYSEEQFAREYHWIMGVIEWFGWWPDFDDAEVVSLFLDRERNSTLKIHFFNTSCELTKSGHYKTSKHAIVAFSMTNIVAINLEGFNNQNVVSGLLLTRGDDGFPIELGCCRGLCGSIGATSIRPRDGLGAIDAVNEFRHANGA